jgi:hypothetical protein
MGVVRVKDGVEFTKIAPGGFRILAVLDSLARQTGDLTITSACDGEHSGPSDPHHRGEAYDVRTHDLPNPMGVLQLIIAALGLEFFYAFLEDPSTPNEHIHIQVKKGSVYPPAPILVDGPIEEA